MVRILIILLDSLGFDYTSDSLGFDYTFGNFIDKMKFCLYPTSENLARDTKIPTERATKIPTERATKVPTERATKVPTERNKIV